MKFGFLVVVISDHVAREQAVRPFEGAHVVRTCFGSFIFSFFWLCFASFSSYPLFVTLRMFCSLLFCDEVNIFVTFLVVEVFEGF